MSKSWKYQPGDNAAWANPDFDDSDWPTIDTWTPRGEFPKIRWTGVGWFRLHLSVDSTLWNIPLSVSVLSRTGFSQVYLDGQPVYQFGEAGQAGPERGPLRRRPSRVVIFQNQTDHVIAVRYVNRAEGAGFRRGFRMVLGDFGDSVQRRTDRVRTSTSYQMFFTGVPLAFALLHLFLYLFYPKSKANLYYTVFTGSIALRTYLRFQGPSGPDDLFGPELLSVLPATTILMTVAGMRFVYSVFYANPPRQFWAFLIGGIALTILWGYKPFIGLPVYLYLFAPAACIEMLHVIFAAILRKKDGAWIIGTGFIAFIIASIYPMLVLLGVVGSVEDVLEPVEDADYILLYGILVLLVSVSVYLSRNFARTSQDLETRLAQVRRLSERTLEQERQAKESEIQRRLLEADNERKTQELQEARKLQLSMLPRNAPSLPNLNIAFAMKPTTEVGGDYYDFNLTTDGTLTVAIGDATGHGLNAGIVVSAVKSLFKTSLDDTNNLQTLHRISEGLKSMNLQRLHMAMTLVTYQNNTITIAAAGMPPVYIYRAAGNRVEEIFMEGMPLGSSVKSVYEQKTFELQTGDTVLLMSDGLPEMLNLDDEMLDYHRTQAYFEAVASKTSEEITEYLFDCGETWADGRHQQDDITFVVMKVR